MYILKTMGTAKIPDYIQIRDDNFALIAHFKTNLIAKALKKFCFENTEEIISKCVSLDYGELLKIN